jgi:hypothetical protein
MQSKSVLQLDLSTIAGAGHKVLIINELVRDSEMLHFLYNRYCHVVRKLLSGHFNSEPGSVLYPETFLIIQIVLLEHGNA